MVPIIESKDASTGFHGRIQPQDLAGTLQFPRRRNRAWRFQRRPSRVSDSEPSRWWLEREIDHEEEEEGEEIVVARVRVDLHCGFVVVEGFGV